MPSNKIRWNSSVSIPSAPPKLSGIWLARRLAGHYSSAMDHHVYFWLKEEFQNEVDRAIFEQGLAALLEIGLVAGGRWAVPAKVVVRPVIDQSWDYALTMQFNTIAEHDAYQVDPDHQVFINTFKEWWAQVQVKDLA